MKVRLLCQKLGVSQDDFVAFAVNKLLSDLGQKPALEVPEAKAKILEAYLSGAIKRPEGS